MKSKEWFESWFDTSYYHSLYKNRDEKEAKLFVTKLVQFLDLNKGTKVLDLACGKGRHSVTLNDMEMNVLGVDLSPNSIQCAKQFETPTLAFQVHDMRELIPAKKFGAVFNLFTSFGYFKSQSDNHKVIQSVFEMLESKGVFILDFMNSEKAIKNMISEEQKEVDGITYSISRKYDGQHIFKDIRFHDVNHDFHFTERVQALKLIDFQKLLTANKFQIIHTFGDFKLNPFDSQTSDRLILIATKN